MRPQRFSALPLAAVGIFCTACSSEPQEVVALPELEESTYQLTVGTWGGENYPYGDQPFRIQASRVSDLDRDPITVLSTNQCSTVSIAQTPDVVHIFYKHLTLSSFWSPSDMGLPVFDLCNLREERCVQLRNSFREANSLNDNICTLNE